jgi:membrane protease subunit HflK
MNDSHHHEHAPKPRRDDPRSMEDVGTQALSEALASSFKLVKVIMYLLVAVFLGSGIREVGSFERAIKLQFGKPVGTGQAAILGSGWHWAWPYPINEIVKIPIGQVQEVSSTVGWYGRTKEQEASGVEPQMMPTLNPVYDGYLFTGDGNIMHSRATLRYRITDAVSYAFDFTSASNIVQNILNNALNDAAAHFKVDDAVRKDVTAFKDAVRRRLDQLLIADQMAISIENLEINSIPPRQVKEAFDAVLGAEATRSKTINDAQAEAARIEATASGTASGITNSAYADASRLTNSVAADARYFQDQLKYYRANPDLYVARLQTEYLGRIMTNVNTKFIQIQSDAGNRRELRLQLNREPESGNSGKP